MTTIVRDYCSVMLIVHDPIVLCFCTLSQVAALLYISWAYPYSKRIRETSLWGWGSQDGRVRVGIYYQI